MGEQEVVSETPEEEGLLDVFLAEVSVCWLWEVRQEQIDMSSKGRLT